MSVMKPDFVDSEYFYVDDDGFHLRKGAPDSVQREFDEFMWEYKEAEDRGALM